MARVGVVDQKNSYIYRTLDRPLYQRADTTVMLHELRNLQLLRGVSHIVQLFAVVVSANPFQTESRTHQRVLRGILLEDYAGDTLEQRLKEKNVVDLPWKEWPLQICRALRSMHGHDIAHGDLKPSNIVLDIEGNAVVLDISGAGAFTYEWLAPELRKKDAGHFTLEARKSSDIWGFGKLLLDIANAVGRIADVTWLLDIAVATAHQDPEKRVGLRDVASRIQQLNLLDNNPQLNLLDDNPRHNLLDDNPQLAG